MIDKSAKYWNYDSNLLRDVLIREWVTHAQQFSHQFAAESEGKYLD